MAEAPVQRIVLYIDDLDRCPPARVVKVLEAVHLLLAFRMFVVVVGVDIRWVAQALRRRYPLQLGDRPGIASPIDYLEKVFQIPFWLPAMSATAGRRLLEAAIGPADPATALSRSETQTADAQLDPERPADGGAPLGARHAIGPILRQLPAVAADVHAPAVPADVQSASAPADARAAAEALVLGNTERYRLLGMSAAVGTSPRRANRFANLYRLLKASLSPAERRGFVLDGGKGGSYGGALTLLAAATGAPQATRVLVAQLAEEPGADPASYLQTRFAAVAPSVLPSEKPAFDAVQAMALAAQDTAAAVRHLRHWAPRVNRFVFDGQD